MLAVLGVWAPKKALHSKKARIAGSRSMIVYLERDIRVTRQAQK
jgi:hypothetical protein